MRLFSTIIVSALLLNSSLAFAKAPDAPPLSHILYGQFLYPNKNNEALFTLGQALFHDKILSGNQNVACSTCHSAVRGTVDGVALNIGEGGRGNGTARVVSDDLRGILHLVQRNAPDVFNRGYASFDTYFHDGRLQGGGHLQAMRTPSNVTLPEGVDNMLAAQALFPPVSPVEMAGQAGENAVADATLSGKLFNQNSSVWGLLVRRLQHNPIYVELFSTAYADVQHADEIKAHHVVNAIAYFQAIAFESIDSRFDRYLSGDETALTAQELKGMTLFLGKANCSSCHSGIFFTDHAFHNIGVPAMASGHDDGKTQYQDWGRGTVTGALADRFAFRTPSLRNVQLTAPYGHNGIFPNLKTIIAYHADPRSVLQNLRFEDVIFPNIDRKSYTGLFFDLGHRETILKTANASVPPLTEDNINALVAFLHSLTEVNFHRYATMAPTSVPSGLPIGD